jgi:hypothetical protein
MSRLGAQRLRRFLGMRFTGEQISEVKVYREGSADP